MAQITPGPQPFATFARRQDDGIDISSILSIGQSVVSSILEPMSTTSTSPSTTLSTSRRTSSVASSRASSSTNSSASTRSSSSSTISSQSSSSTSESGSSTVSAASATSSPTKSSNSSSKLPIILGAVLGIVTLILIGLVILLCCRRRRKKGYIFRGSGTGTPTSEGESEVIITPELTKDEEPSYRYATSTSPTMRSPVSAPSQRPSNGYASIPDGDPIEETSVWNAPPGRYYNNRRSRHSSSTLDPVYEVPVRTMRNGDHMASDSSFSRPRRWSGSSGNGNSMSRGSLGSPKMQTIPRKPLASQNASNAFDDSINEPSWNARDDHGFDDRPRPGGRQYGINF